MRIAKKLGVTRSSLPILIADGQLVQGSAKIIDWTDAAISNHANTLTLNTIREECLEIEKRLDNIIGVHIRRFFTRKPLPTIRRQFA